MLFYLVAVNRLSPQPTFESDLQHITAKIFIALFSGMFFDIEVLNNHAPQRLLSSIPVPPTEVTTGVSCQVANPLTSLTCTVTGASPGTTVKWYKDEVFYSDGIFAKKTA